MVNEKESHKDAGVNQHGFTPIDSGELCSNPAYDIDFMKGKIDFLNIQVVNLQRDFQDFKIKVLEEMKSFVRGHR